MTCCSISPTPLTDPLGTGAIAWQDADMADTGTTDLTSTSGSTSTTGPIPTAVGLVGAEEIGAAAALLEGVVRYTPMESSRPLNLLVGGPVYLKCENLQRTGSFKIRGAYTRIARLTDEERSKGVVAASAGNHAQGVALAAAMLGCDATVYMPVGASIAKLAATRAYGATVHLVGDTLDESLIAAKAFAARTGAVLVHPFDHPD